MGTYFEKQSFILKLVLDLATSDRGEGLEILMTQRCNEQQSLFHTER